LNPLIQKLLGSVVRLALVWLSAKFGATLSDNEIVQLTMDIVPVLVLLWSFRQKIHSERVTLTAQTMRAGATRKEVLDEVKDGYTPSVWTPKNVAPV
jgi:hypothetical protein